MILCAASTSYAVFFGAVQCHQSRRNGFKIVFGSLKSPSLAIRYTASQELCSHALRSFVLQLPRLSEYAAEHQDGNYQLLLGVGCANALAYNVVHYLMIQRTSAVTTTVLGEIKIVGLLLLSALLLGVLPADTISRSSALPYLGDPFPIRALQTTRIELPSIFA